MNRYGSGWQERDDDGDDADRWCSGWYDDEVTWLGRERAEELDHRPVFELRDQSDGPVPYALRTLLLVVCVLGSLAMLGVAFDWFDREFARQMLLITLVPSCGAWLVTVLLLRPPRGPG